MNKIHFQCAKLKLEITLRPVLLAVLAFVDCFVVQAACGWPMSRQTWRRKAAAATILLKDVGLLVRIA